MTQKFYQQILGIAVAMVTTTMAYANNLSVANISLGSRNPSAKTLVVSFDLTWENSWRNKINHDAVWMTVRLANSSDPSLGSTLCKLALSGTNPQGMSAGTDSTLEVNVPSDKIGAFLRRSSNGPVKNITSQSVKLVIDYNSCGFNDGDQVTAGVFAWEMVYIPEGSFYAGDNGSSTASLKKGSADNSPWKIESENSINLTNVVNNGFYYQSAGNAGEFNTGTTFIIPANFPKGYRSFYAMKYEINEGQWVDFINSLPSSARLNRDITDNNHKNSDNVVSRNTISCSGSPLVCTTSRGSRAATFLSWMDLAAYLDWAGLRPMTELEFEKIARGPVLPNSGEFAWGSTDIVAADTINGTENGSETILTSLANANFANTLISGGDASLGTDYQNGPVRNGIFATSSTNRITSGGSYYGLMEISGNVAERVVTIGNSAGLIFDGSNGDGVLTNVSTNEGNANVTTWPGFDSDVSKGITSANGSGIKGGSWIDSANLLRISDRSQAALATAAATSSSGGRGVRSYEVN